MFVVERYRNPFPPYVCKSGCTFTAQLLVQIWRQVFCQGGGLRGGSREIKGSSEAL